MLLKGRAAMSALTMGARHVGRRGEHLLGGRIRVDDAEGFSDLRETHGIDAHDAASTRSHHAAFFISTLLRYA